MKLEGLKSGENPAFFKVDDTRPIFGLHPNELITCDLRHIWFANLAKQDCMYAVQAKTELWPIRPKPKPDELLSSWLVRLAFRSGLKLQTFCRMNFGHRPIWNRDIDKSVDTTILQILTNGTGTTPEAVFNTTLKAYENWIYRQHNPYGNTQWILPLGVYHRIRRGYGLQYCPQCLAEPDGPYFRRRWRLAFMVACTKHGTELTDRCPVCDAPVCIHRREMGRRSSLPDGATEHCFSCHHDLSRTKVESIPNDELEYHRFLEQGMEQGWMTAPNGVPVYAHLYFEVLHQIMKLLISTRSRNMGEIVSKATGMEAVPIPGQHAEPEHLTVADRRKLLIQARWLLAEWPERFIRLCRDNQIWSTWVLRDMTNVPWWFSSVVQSELYVRHAPFDAEHNRKTRRYKAHNTGR